MGSCPCPSELSARTVRYAHKSDLRAANGHGRTPITPCREMHDAIRQRRKE
jgi:hypothetical protein